MKKIIFLPILFLLVACGPSDEEILKEKEEQIVNSWREFLFDKEAYKSGGATISGYITEDNSGIVVRYTESNCTSVDWDKKRCSHDGTTKKAIISMSEGLNIPDYIKEKILRTTPIDGRQEDQFDNLSITWAIDPDYDLGTIEIFIMLRLI